MLRHRKNCSEESNSRPSSLLNRPTFTQCARPWNLFALKFKLYDDNHVCRRWFHLCRPPYSEIALGHQILTLKPQDLEGGAWRTLRCYNAKFLNFCLLQNSICAINIIHGAWCFNFARFILTELRPTTDFCLSNLLNRLRRWSMTQLAVL